MAEAQQGAPVAEIDSASDKQVPLDAGPKPSLPVVAAASAGNGVETGEGDETDEEAPEKEVGLEYLYDNDELPEEASDDEDDFDDPGEAGDDDYAEEEEDDEDDYNPEPEETVSGKRRTAGTGRQTGPKRPRTDEED